ncbi:MAG: photosystem II stability/assembly factor-like uncharacterized protein [Myxococcota bacterium]|jgi:photosystem II stability/assembly factor-like uncharacterized protein
MWWLLSLLACGGPQPEADAPAVEALAAPVAVDAPPPAQPPAKTVRGKLLRPPTEAGPNDLAAERSNKTARKKWFEELHRGREGRPWREIERENGLAQIRKRNAIASGARPLVDLGPARWEERGSENQAGRMHAATLTSDGDWLYAGSALGGIWRGHPDGSDWTPLGDNLYGGAHHMAVLRDGEVIVASTNWGRVHRTEDEGRTWETPSGIPYLWGVRRLVEYGGDVFLVISEPYDNCALMRSTDDGLSFQVVLDMPKGCGDVWVPREDGGAMFAFDGPDLYASADGGDSWQVRGALPSSGKTELTGSEAGAPRLYAVSDSEVLHRSDDAGWTWQEMQRVEDYWGRLIAGIDDPDRFAWGGVEVHLTRDGGESFTRPNEWWEYYEDPENLLHADIMGMQVQRDESGAELWYISTDGGLYVSRDALDSVKNLALEGLRVSQYYDVHTSVSKPEQVAAGAQDQGFQRTTEAFEGRYRFDQLISGDYGHITSSDGTHKLLYTNYPGVMLVLEGQNDPAMYWVDFPADTHAWIPPIVADPEDPESVFFCGGSLWRYERGGEDWWAPTQWSDQSFSSDGYEYMSALAFSPLDTDRAYAATSYGRLFWSTDRGQTWTDARDGTAPWPHYFYGHALHPSIVDPELVYVGGSGYNGASGVMRSTNGGKRWDDWSEGLPETHVYALVEAPDGSGTMFAGTESAAYMREVDGAAWVDITGADAPVTIYWSAEALQHENTIRFGTYGRGIWDYQLDPEGVGCFPVVDHDGDGTMCDEDCADFDPSIYPGADAVCGDGIDQACDGSELDEDGDGSPACADCDDASDTTHPDAEDVCGNLIDEDCDGVDALCIGGDGDGDGDGKKCGCATGGPSGGWLVLGLVGVLARRRLRAVPA